MESMKPYFTVFTPTYNRADRLFRVYNSLKNQTLNDFEWLIIDDGSTDNTKEVVEEFIGRNEISIRYIYQENGHKKKAFNHAVREAKGYFFIPADSDDEFDSNTLSIFKEIYNKQPEDVKTVISGVVCLCKSEDGSIIGDEFPKSEWLSDQFEMRYVHSIKGEKWGCIKTDILRLFPFPESVMGHVPENVIWTPIAKKYKTIFINEPLRTYFTDEFDSITNSKFSKVNAHGALILSKVTLEHELNYFFYNPVHFIKTAANYTRFKLHVDRQDRKSSDFVENGNYPMLRKGLILMCMPLGCLLYLRDLNK
ncbi:glycosyltransferase family A protein [Vibrio cholerae]|uniref:glycosyltransferase family A protein n=1 Tax=Vibrio cholerae TaxID=666 RepID=UPI00155EA7C6|nr:glycosyltransferase family A protein [Vibrio cholerae]NOF19698.1 glycosyltransferase family 2 protein [Vibrio cholerae]